MKIKATAAFEIEVTPKIFTRLFCLYFKETLAQIIRIEDNTRNTIDISIRTVFNQ
jgi:hypothetical protein